jgi:O-antigen ligase
MSTQYNPAALGSFLLGCLPFFGFLVLRKGRRSWLALAGFAACLSVLIWTFSRGVFLGLIAAVFFFCLMSGRKRLLAGFLLGVCCLVAVFSFSSNLNLNRFGFSRFIAGSQDSVFSPYRMTRLQITGAMVKDHPFTGIGLNNFRVRFADYQPSAARESYEFMIADNMYLTLAAEAGLPCLAAFLLFIAMLFRGHPGATRRSVAALLPMTALVGLLVNMGAYELFYWNNIFMLFCLLCGFLAQSKLE